MKQCQTAFIKSTLNEQNQVVYEANGVFLSLERTGNILYYSLLLKIICGLSIWFLPDRCVISNRKLLSNNFNQAVAQREM